MAERARSCTPTAALAALFAAVAACSPVASAPPSHPATRPAPAPVARTPATQPAPVDPMAMGNPARDGSSQHAGPTALGEPARLLETGARPAGQVLLDGQGGVVFATRDGRVHALDAQGGVRWSLNLEEPIEATPALDKAGNLYVATAGGWLMSFERSGSERWRVQLDGPVSADLLVSPDGAVFVAGPGLYAFESDGTQRFHHVTGDLVLSAPALHPDGFVVFGTVHGRVIAVGLDGQLRWERSGGAAISAGASIAHDGTVLIANLLGQVICLSARGARQWEFETEGEHEIRATPAVASDGAIAFGSHDGNLYVLEPDGRLRHRIPLGGRLSASARIDPAGTLFVGSSDQMLHAVDIVRGEVMHSVNAGQGLLAPVAIGRDGALYTTPEHGILLAFR